MDAVLYPLAPEESTYPTVQRLRRDAQVTAFRIRGKDFDDTFILSEENTGEVRVGGISFEGRAILVRRQPELRVLAVGASTVQVDGQTVVVEDK